MNELRDVFERIAADNAWLNSESRSGDGSTLAYTQGFRDEVEAIARALDVKTFFDAPCGDFNWMRAVTFPEGMLYLGGDIARPLVADNKAKYGSERRRFIDFDIAHDSFPDADIWFCRDCLFHLSETYIFKALRNFCNSTIRLVMMTNHINLTGFKNSDGRVGGFRLIDFHGAPFNLPRDVLFRVKDYVDDYPPREMCVWTREQIVAALQHNGE
jgi:hypothetical protein